MINHPGDISDSPPSSSSWPDVAKSVWCHHLLICNAKWGRGETSRQQSPTVLCQVLLSSRWRVGWIVTEMFDREVVVLRLMQYYNRLVLDLVLYYKIHFPVLWKYIYYLKIKIISLRCNKPFSFEDFCFIYIHQTEKSQGAKSGKYVGWSKLIYYRFVFNFGHNEIFMLR